MESINDKIDKYKIKISDKLNKFDVIPDTDKSIFAFLKNDIEKLEIMDKYLNQESLSQDAILRKMAELVGIDPDNDVIEVEE